MSSRQRHHQPQLGPSSALLTSLNLQHANNMAQQLQQHNSATAGGTPSIVDEDLGFLPIISDIMRGFGDCARPLDETVALVESILLQQLRAILSAVIDAAVRRCGRPQPTRTDFEFLMRRNPIKVQRLQQHIRDLQLKRKWEELHLQRSVASAMAAGNAAAVAALHNVIDDELDTNGAAEGGGSGGGDVVEQRYDEEKVRRVYRADRISQMLNGPDYIKYNEARKASFCCKQAPRIRLKLRRWLGAEYALSNEVFTILAYLAHETIAVLIDYAILTRLTSENRAHEPWQRVVAAKAVHTLLHLCPEVTQGRAADGVRAVTVAEVQEAMRRVVQGSARSKGVHRNFGGRPEAMPFLAF